MSVGQILLPLRVLFVLTTGLSLVELRPLVAWQWSIPFAPKYVVKVPVQHLWLSAEKKRAGRQRYLPGSSKSQSVVDCASMISILGAFVIRCRCWICAFKRKLRKGCAMEPVRGTFSIEEPSSNPSTLSAVPDEDLFDLRHSGYASQPLLLIYYIITYYNII